MTCEDKMHRLVLDDGQVVSGRTVLIATGASYRRLPVADCGCWTGGGIIFFFYTTPAPRCTRTCKNGRRRWWGAGHLAGLRRGDGSSRTIRPGRLCCSAEGISARICRTISPAGSNAISKIEISPPRRGRRHSWEQRASRAFDFAIATRGVLGTSIARRCSSSSAPEPRTSWLPPSVAVDAKGFILTSADAAHCKLWPLTNREPCTVETTSPGVRRGRRPKQHHEAGCLRRRRRSAGGHLSPSRSG